ncbi:hypothetical protein B0A50_07717 [Salinomyces thailandicus]|uniref:Zn(2)-C6 fungal-type domain-containing protein n=1 Tax=Salinomyces thailandicus TaxID=706561 RepID=A0A4U0TLJ5_9PEZI|nr:hypothetical protein B0A50_07717 [Salinomyces thailandica]
MAAVTNPTTTTHHGLDSQSAADVNNNNGASVPIATSTSAAHIKQKRVRSQLSCTSCRQGKLKCNREKPACDQCCKRGRDVQCLYLPPPVKRNRPQNVKGRIRQLEDLVVGLMGAQQQGASRRALETERRDGIDVDGSRRPGAEAGVGGPNTGGESSQSGRSTSFSQPTPPSDGDTGPQFGGSQGAQTAIMPNEYTPDSLDEDDAASTAFGQMKISKNEISYVGSTHWGAILNSISELKQDLGDDDGDECPDSTSADTESHAAHTGSIALHPDTDISGSLSDASSATGRAKGLWTGQMPTAGLGFMYESAGVFTKDQLIAAVPEKRTTDRLLSLWFNSPDPFKPVIHAPSFQDEYKRFWKDPQSTPIMWLSLLFSILSLAASFALRDAGLPSSRARQVHTDVNRYHAHAASAAVLADFTQPKPHTVEALIIYTAGLRSDNAFLNVWLSIGLMIRLALRMGYHRDAKHYPNITPFQGEMRRRTWAILTMIDVLVSFQLGLPSMVKTLQSDASPPRNLLDRDFGPTCSVLPEGRVVDELTPSSYTRAKLVIVKIFADAAELSHATVPPAYADMMELDRRLEEAKALIPPLLQMTEDNTDSLADPAEQLMCRFNLDLLYLKTKTVLHRRYMFLPFEKLTLAEQAYGVGDSRRLCTECALRVLQHHQTIYAASQKGGQLESVKWYMGSISTHDFLLAAMIICLELSKQIHDPSFGVRPSDGAACPRRGPMMEALERSQAIWSEAAGAKTKAGDFMGHGFSKKDTSVSWDTAKAARAMAVMLEKVRAQFGARGYAAGQVLVGGCDGGLSAAVREHAATRESIASRNIVNGARGLSDSRKAAGSISAPLDNVGWADFNNPPVVNFQSRTAAHENGHRPGTTTNGSYNSQSETNAPAGLNNNTPYAFDPVSSSTNVEPRTTDFSAIGSMLDFDANDVDWEMWDNEMAAGTASSLQHRFPEPRPDTAAWPTELDSQGNMMNPFNFNPGNALVGGTGLIDTHGCARRGGMQAGDD